MACPHGLRSQPSTCSLCVGAAARQVTVQDGEVLIDGEPAGRGTDPLANGESYYARRARKEKRE